MLQAAVLSDQDHRLDLRLATLGECVPDAFQALVDPTEEF